jgi:DNA-binding IclR family transcriptional regulator
MAAETMSMKVLAALNEGAKTLADVTEKTGIPRPKTYATLHQLLKEGKATRTGPRGWERGRWAPSAAATSEEATPSEETIEEPKSGIRTRSTMRSATRLAG